MPTAALAAANDREAARFGLAIEAIKLFHGEVGDDLVLKEDQFKPLRDKLLRGATDFYRKLEGLLRDQSDRASRMALGRAYNEHGGLTAKIGDMPSARRRRAGRWRFSGPWPPDWMRRPRPVPMWRAP